MARVSLLRRFLSSRDGGAAIMFAFSLVPVALGVGAAIDYSRATSARTALQARVDEAALAIASSSAEQQKDVSSAATRVLEQSPLPFGTSAAITKAEIDEATDDVRVEATGIVPTTFVRIVGMQTIDVGVQATARRANSGNVEIAIVLDNTWSMSEKDAAGTSKIDALKKSATDLVNQISPNARSTVKFALVPYANYVNVGLSNRYKGWVKVEPDYTVPGSRDCKTVSSETKCTASGPPKTCTRYNDGVASTYNCTPSSCTTTPIEPKEQCTNRGEQKHRWFGCVGSRVTGDLRLNDDSPTTPYPGFLGTSQNCPTEIVPLTSDKSKVTSAIQAMAINSYTYIPAGLVWGLNVLSPTEPFTEGLSSTASGPQPRKFLVLMTDGENTMAMKKTDGTHYNADTSPTAMAATNADTAKLCENVKAKGIELFTVAFALKSTTAKSMLQACATDSDHYFDAANGAALSSAFEKIARSISGVVRLSR